MIDENEKEYLESKIINKISTSPVAKEVNKL
jgi:hypothetical protein